MNRRSVVVAWVLVASCSTTRKPDSKALEHSPADPLAELVAIVGTSPRVAVTFALNEPVLRAHLSGIEHLPPVFGGRSFKACGVDLATLRQVRLAIGEPLVIAAELDGAIDHTQARCIIGDKLLKVLAASGLELRDRPGGIALMAVKTPSRSTAQATIEGLVEPCARRLACAALVLGPTGRELRVEAHIEDGGLTWRLSGPGMSQVAADSFAAAVKALTTRVPALGGFVVRSGGGELVATFVDAQNEEVRRALKQHLVEAFRVPSSSMVPTLQIGDNIFAVKGPMQGPIAPGMVVVHRGPEDRLFLKRVVAIGGQVVTETEAGLVIDGLPLATELVDPGYRYVDPDPITGSSSEHTGKLVREQLGGQSHLIIRTGEARRGSWTIPPDHYFLVGDNRENSNDSRFQGSVPEDAIVGRVLGVWLAMRDGAPDWARMGTGIE